ncbi:Transposase [Stigmatella aurantiaca DW4/3-1]|uniref:Transposase n=1 Tax=Stigmatella aurantiaca (strain DW4/3-1) TaxID=378806 RepID=E3FF29_STIAD|nr:Transposase [Stigmatella aurantiaca DW4/3-1]
MSQEPPDDKGNPTVDFHGEKRSNAVHASTTDPESRLARRGCRV